MNKQYSKIADSSDALMIKEAIEELSNAALGSDIRDSIAQLVNELREARIQRDREIEGLLKAVATPAPEVDVKGIVLGLQQMKPERPSYQFKIQRDHNGLLVGIQATPSTGDNR
jgi:hypothetical protein